MTPSRRGFGAEGPAVRRPSDAGHDITIPGRVNRNLGGRHPDLGPDEPLGPLFAAADPGPAARRRVRPVHPDLAPALAASSLADALGDAYDRHLRRFSGVFRLDVQGVPCAVSLVVASDPDLPIGPVLLTWELDEPRPDGYTQQFVIAVRPNRVPQCSCPEYERDWDCRHIRALQVVGILGSPAEADEDSWPADCEADEAEGGAR